MVSEIPSYDEYYGLLNNIVSHSDFYANLDDDEQNRILAALLLVLEDFYNDIKSMNVYDTSSSYFKDKCKNLVNNLNNSMSLLLDNYVQSVQVEEDVKWAIPSGEVNPVIKLKKLINTSVDALVNQLKDDINMKAQYMLLFAIEEEFTVYSNFRRAIRRLTDIVKNTTTSVKKSVERKYLEFVYGEEALFEWRCSGRNTCEWCYSIEALGPQPLSMFPNDHPNGGCSLIPVNPTDYTEQYLQIRRYEV